MSRLLSPPDTMRVIGIDPGTVRLGYGIVDISGSSAHAVSYGVISPHQEGRGERLLFIYRTLSALLRRYRPEQAVVEELFFERNKKTAMRVGEARGVIFLALAERSIPFHEISPPSVKRFITGYGTAEKLQIQRLVQHILHLKELPRPDDAADALALALCSRHF